MKYEAAGTKVCNEARKAQFLSEELEHVKNGTCQVQVSRKRQSPATNNGFSKGFKRKLDQVTSREVDALKEKIHEYMATEDLICHLQGRSFRFCKRNSGQQENRNRDLGREIENLTKRVRAGIVTSVRASGPISTEERISDPQVFSKEVQTEAAD